MESVGSLVLRKEKHAEYVVEFQKDKAGYEYVASEYLRLSGIYWGTTALWLLAEDEEGKEFKERLPREEVVKDVMACWNGDGGFGSAPGHDSHLLYTLSAVQVLVTYGALEEELSGEDRERTAAFVAGLQSAEDGSFRGDKWGEVDTRFSYCAASCLTLLGVKPLESKIDVPKAVEFVLACRNFDEGFGARPGDETHAGQVFCCVGALTLLGALDRVDKDRLAWWLCERQTKGGGLNGRPQKLHDVCYTWWVLSSLQMLGRLHWVDRSKLIHFILSCQDEIDGGISDRPDDEVDIFHTFFGIAGLSLLGYPGLEPVDARYAMPARTMKELGL
ncbi:subunit beta of geranylgeranyl transferase type-2 [Chloropicon primus]|uniref:Geranylgeranyl transferase type-2 subunit beta n=1 Tax=Chloropicon primus TaxID=1764295 RepID=A0A5B8MQE3_9CHLO|nr:subunit beta of geranylgeranyl transferase type-2 [Chloropicon primus]UPR00733.1 subunit beta of geranylgeranyl transferase type-2 [Chloropicon primus]|eukprot:QDZ21522.1 subunit beta of geranylgeranyl transferase type-2 [Chloropicon primus]